MEQLTSGHISPFNDGQGNVAFFSGAVLGKNGVDGGFLWIFCLFLGCFFVEFIDFSFSGSIGFNDVIFSSPQTVFCVHGV